MSSLGRAGAGGDVGRVRGESWTLARGASGAERTRRESCPWGSASRAGMVLMTECGEAMMTDPSETTDRTCHACSGETLREEGMQTLRRTVGGREFEREVPALVCPGCGETSFSTVDLAALERQIADEVIRLELRTPDAVEWVLDGYDLEPDLIGATWPEVKAWARGEGAPPASVWPSLLAAVQLHQAPRDDGTPAA
ncbi:MAG: YgiT-type zinc finger protein [Myxococcales bacterium]|nr:MAG: YgiT-type zinc finger protein [Myxococcales bacterium]